MNFKFVGEIIGIIAIIESFFIFLSNRRKNILMLKAASNALWAVNGFMVGAYTGGVLNIILTFREFVFYNRIDKKWAQYKFWKYFFILLCFASPVLEMIKTGTFNIIPFLPAGGSVLAVYGFYSEKPKVIRVLNFFATVPWLVYNIFTHNITASISGVVSLASILCGSLLAKIIKK